MTADLLQRAKTGDAQAFNHLIEAHREVMFRYAYLITRHAEDTEDVVQDATLSLYQYLQRVDTTRPFRPYALQVVRNLARNKNRSFGRYKHMIQRWLQYRETQTASVEALTVEQQHAQDLHAAVAQLKETHQDVVYARYFLQLSVEETASILNIAEGTVKSRLHRALKQLKGIIHQTYPHLEAELTK